MQTDHVLTILAVVDLEASLRFYRAAFAWAEQVTTPLYVEFELPRGQRVGLYQRDGFGRNTGQVPVAVAAPDLVPVELYFRVEAMEPVLTRLDAAGARALSPPAKRPWGDTVAYFADPDGHVLAFAVMDG